MRLVETANGFHWNMALARFLGQGRPPAIEILDARMQLFSRRTRQPHRRMNVDMMAVGVHHEHIFMAGKFPGERRPRGVHEHLFVGLWLGAQNHMGKIARRVGSHRRRPGLRDLKRRIDSLWLGPIAVARLLREQAVGLGFER